MDTVSPLDLFGDARVSTQIHEDLHGNVCGGDSSCSPPVLCLTEDELNTSLPVECSMEAVSSNTSVVHSAASSRCHQSPSVSVSISGTSTHTLESLQLEGETLISRSLPTDLPSVSGSVVGGARFKCDACEFVTPERGKLMVHKRKHTGVKSFQCSDCASKFTRKYYLKRHMVQKHNIHTLLHLNKCPRYCSYAGCNFVSRNKTLATIHAKSHSCPKPWYCKSCDKRYGQRRSLLQHVVNKHDGDELLMGLLDWAQMNSDLLKAAKPERKQLRSAKNIRKLSPTSAPVNGMQDSVPDGVSDTASSNHQPAESLSVGQAPNLCEELEEPSDVYRCDRCDFEVRSFKPLYAHKQKCHKDSNATGSLVSCSQCSKRFASASALRTHVKQQHPTSSSGIVSLGMGTRRKTTYRCDQCGYTTFLKYLFDTHIGSHHGSCNVNDHHLDMSSGHVDIDDHLVNGSSIGERSPSMSEGSSGGLNQLPVAMSSLRGTYQCHLCSFVTNIQSSLEIHSSQVHQKEHQEIVQTSCPHTDHRQTSPKPMMVDRLRTSPAGSRMKLELSTPNIGKVSLSSSTNGTHLPPSRSKNCSAVASLAGSSTFMDQGLALTPDGLVGCTSASGVGASKGRISIVTPGGYRVGSFEGLDMNMASTSAPTTSPRRSSSSSTTSTKTSNGNNIIFIPQEMMTVGGGQSPPSSAAHQSRDMHYPLNHNLSTISLPPALTQVVLTSSNRQQHLADTSSTTTKLLSSLQDLQRANSNLTAVCEQQNQELQELRGDIVELLKLLFPNHSIFSNGYRALTLENVDNFVKEVLRNGLTQLHNNIH